MTTITSKSSPPLDGGFNTFLSHEIDFSQYAVKKDLDLINKSSVKYRLMSKKDLNSIEVLQNIEGFLQRIKLTVEQTNTLKTNIEKIQPLYSLDPSAKKQIETLFSLLTPKPASPPLTSARRSISRTPSPDPIPMSRSSSRTPSPEPTPMSRSSSRTPSPEPTPMPHSPSHKPTIDSKYLPSAREKALQEGVVAAISKRTEGKTILSSTSPQLVPDTKAITRIEAELDSYQRSLHSSYQKMIFYPHENGGRGQLYFAALKQINTGPLPEVRYVLTKALLTEAQQKICIVDGKIDVGAALREHRKSMGLI